jgi:hypothetical protein
MGLRGIGSHPLSRRGTPETSPQRPNRNPLSHAQQMWLRYGWDERWDDAFDSEAEYAEVWALHRERLLAACRHGRRPMAWWALEAPIPYPGHEHEQVVLYEARLLAPDERAELVTEWREEFEKAQAADFWFCLGSGRSLKGAPARRAHYRWANIPRELVREWTAQRQ